MTGSCLSSVPNSKRLRGHLTFLCSLRSDQKPDDLFRRWSIYSEPYVSAQMHPPVHHGVFFVTGTMTFSGGWELSTKTTFPSSASFFTSMMKVSGKLFFRVGVTLLGSEV